MASSATIRKSSTIQNPSSGDPAQVFEREGLEVVTTDQSAGGR
jgi:hypothetical protein